MIITTSKYENNFNKNHEYSGQKPHVYIQQPLSTNFNGYFNVHVASSNFFNEHL